MGERPPGLDGPGSTGDGYTVLEPETRITWNMWWGHGLWASITDADGDAMTLVSAGGAAGVPATPLLLVRHAEIAGSTERRISAWIDGALVAWQGVGYAKSASETWVIASPVYYPQPTPAFPIERLLGAETLVLEIGPAASGLEIWPVASGSTLIRVEMDLGGDMGVMHPISIMLREHLDYVALARARGWPIL